MELSFFYFGHLIIQLTILSQKSMISAKLCDTSTHKNILFTSVLLTDSNMNDII